MGLNIMPILNNVCGTKSFTSFSLVVTGCSQFALFITVNVITFLAVFDGIILIAFATDWFDVSGFLSQFYYSVRIVLDFSQM